MAELENFGSKNLEFRATRTSPAETSGFFVTMILDSSLFRFLKLNRSIWPVENDRMTALLALRIRYLIVDDDSRFATDRQHLVFRV